MPRGPRANSVEYAMIVSQARVRTLFAMPDYGAFVPAAGVNVGRHSLERFPNGELRVRLGIDVAGADCFVIGSVAPPDERLTSFLLLTHTLAKDHARRIVAVLPYLAYARQDRDEPRESLAAEWLGALLDACGVDAVVTVDIHSDEILRRFPIPVVSLSPAPVFASKIAELDLNDFTVVAPDVGARDRAYDVARATGPDTPLAYLPKRRHARGITHAPIVGRLSGRAVIVDDILDTGATLVSCCRELSRAGVEDITVFVTHGLFTGDAWRELWPAGATRIYTTDSVPDVRADGVEVLSVAGLLGQALLEPAEAAGKGRFVR
jgi:ribose-phosphate pyrophosphokinase